MNPTKRVAYFDPFSGASGDMILGALIDAGVSLDSLRSGLGALPLDGYTIDALPFSDRAVNGTRFTVTVETDAPSRTWADIRTLIESSGLSDNAKSLALRWFTFLAEAEAEVHNVLVEEVHFHEVGAVDSIVDICGIAIAMDLLGIEEIRVGPLRVGSGFVNTEHGVLPVPAPATAVMLARSGAVLAADSPVAMSTAGELLTPTGAAILLADGTPGRPAMAVESVSYGFGQKSFPWPNAIGLWIGAVAAEVVDDAGETPLDCVVIETNIDDMNPQAFELLMERLFAAGALDAWKTAIAMKKGRLGTMVSVLARIEQQEELEMVLLQQSTTFGVRTYRTERRIAERAWLPIATRFGDIRVKCKGLDDRVVDVAPEYDDVVAAARSTGASFDTVWSETRRLGEALIGRSVVDVVTEAESS